MVKIIRDVAITALLSFFFCAILFELCYADENEVSEEVIENEIVMEDTNNESQSDQSDVISDPALEPLRDLYIQNLIVLPSEDEVEEEEEEVLVYSALAQAPSNSLPNIPRNNTVLYRGSFAGRDCWLLLPLGSTDSLTTINGVLINVGSSSITGRLFYTDEIDLTSFEDTFLVLTSQFSTNLPNQLFMYQYSSFARYYYHNGTRLTYSDTYGDFTVTEQLDTKDNRPIIVIQTLLVPILLFLGIHFISKFFLVAK